MTTPVRTIPKWFPDLRTDECFNHRILKASLIRKLAMAQNFLWSRGRTYGTGYEGQGFGMFRTAMSGLTVDSDGFQPLCDFYIPQSYGPNSTLQVDVTLTKAATVTSVTVIIKIAKLDGTPVSTNTFTGLAAGLNTVELLVPKYGEFQARVGINATGFSGGGLGAISVGGAICTCSHVSARWKPDTTNYRAVWTDYGSNQFTDNYPMSSMFLLNLLKNVQTLWATRQPELCQSYLFPPWTNGSTGSFIEVGRYRVWTPSKVTKYSGKLYVYCTSGGAGNEVRVLLNGSVVQTFTALASGYQELTLSAGKTMTDNQYNLFTVEAKSTDAANWGTCVWGVYLWENGCTMPSLPSAYKPLDETALSGDSQITAQDLNSYSQRSGIRQLFNNDRWLAGNRYRVMVSDWRHRAYKRGGLIGGVATNPDVRTDWTFDMGDVNYDGLQAPKNMTIRADANSTGAFDTNDALGDWPAGEGNMGGSYQTTPFAFPTIQTYYHQGRRLAHIPLMSGSAGENTSGSTYNTHIEAGGSLRLLGRASRIRTAKENAQTKNISFLADDDGSSLDENDELQKGQSFLQVQLPTGTIIDTTLTAKDAASDHTLRWLPSMIGKHNNASGYLDVKGWVYPFAVGGEGILWELQLGSLFIEDLPLGQAQIDAL